MNTQRLKIFFLLLATGAFQSFASTFPEWKSSKFTPLQLSDSSISGDSADPDGDGKVNLMEYALGLEPLVADSDVTMLVPDGEDYYFEYPEVISLSDLTYHLDFSTDLLQWGRLTPNPALRDVLSEENGKRYLSIWNPNVSPSSKKWFTRLFVAIDSGGPNQFLAPTNLSAGVGEPLAVNLAWNDNTRLETSTIIERDSGSGFSQVSTLASDIITWHDNDVTGSATYTYRVHAQSAGGPSAFSNEVTITLPLDSDGDGLSDQAEISRFNTDPFNADSDGDGMPDGWEVRNGLDPRSDLAGLSDFDGDLDADGLENGFEYLLGLNPNSKDSDGNGVEDSLEDSDGDGIPNGWEAANGTDPSDRDDDLDPDTDGLTNAEELEAGTLPFNAYSDTDAEMDGDDGWPTDGILAPPRLANRNYAVFLLPPTSEMLAIGLSDGNHVVFEKNRTYSLWVTGNITTLPIPQGNIESENPENLTGINLSGGIVGTRTLISYEGTSEDVFYLPLGAGSATILPRLHEHRTEENGDETLASYFPPIIANNGTVFSYYLGNNSVPETIQGGVKWVNGSASQHGGRLRSGVANSEPVQEGVLLAPVAANENGTTIGAYFLGLDQPAAEQERGVGIWNGSLFKVDTDWNRSKLLDITKDNHVLGYINYGTSFLQAIWISKNGTWTPRELSTYVYRINDGMQGVTGTQLWQNDKLIEREDLTSEPGLIVNNLQDINNAGLILSDVTKDGVNRSALLVPIEVLKPRLDDEGNETGKFRGVDSLKVAQWENAWRTDATPYGELVDDFIEKDPDRFYLRVPIIGSAETMQIKLSTVDAGGATIDDWEEIEMEIDPENSAMLKSKSQLLVADTTDKTAAGAENSEEIIPRFHKVSLLGKVKVQLHIGQATSEIELPVPGVGKYKTVTVNAVILREVPGGAPAATESFVWNDLVNNVKSAYAQANINISIGRVTVADPPTGVDLTDGLALAGINSIPQEVKNLLDALGTPSPDDIHIFYVPSITMPPGGEIGGRGYALVDAFFQQPTDRPYVYNVFVGKSQMNYLTTPHELGHLLTNGGHIEEWAEHTNSNAMYLQRNLMFGYWVDPFLPRRSDGSIFDSKRLWNSQIKAIRNNPHAN